MQRIRKRHRVQSEDDDNDNEDKDNNNEHNDNNDNFNEDNDSGDNDNEINQDKDNKDIKVQNLIIAVCLVLYIPVLVVNKEKSAAKEVEDKTWKSNTCDGFHGLI